MEKMESSCVLLEMFKYEFYCMDNSQILYLV